MEDLQGKTALVTGASRGIGRAIARRLASDGARVGIHYATNEAASHALRAEIAQAGGRAFTIRADFGRDDHVELLCASLKAELDGAPLDILVNNAGILDATPFEQITPDAFDQSYAINVRAPFFLVQRILPMLVDGGRIITIASAVTRIASPFFHYTMNKAAIQALTHTLAQALGARGITVNAVAPGVIETDMGAWVHSAPGLAENIVGTIALGRLGQPDDIADVVAFLASPDARWITGVTLDASGGQGL